MHWSKMLRTELAVTPDCAGDASDIIASRSEAQIVGSQRLKDRLLFSAGNCSEARRVGTNSLRYSVGLGAEGVYSS